MQPGSTLVWVYPLTDDDGWNGEPEKRIIDLKGLTCWGGDPTDDLQGNTHFNSLLYRTRGGLWIRARHRSLGGTRSYAEISLKDAAEWFVDSWERPVSTSPATNHEERLNDCLTWLLDWHQNSATLLDFMLNRASASFQEISLNVLAEFDQEKSHDDILAIARDANRAMIERRIPLRLVAREAGSVRGRIQYLLEWNPPRVLININASSAEPVEFCQECPAEIIDYLRSIDLEADADAIQNRAAPSDLNGQSSNERPVSNPNDDLESRAIALFFAHPAWTVDDLAANLGCHKRSLAKSRCPRLAAVREAAKAAKEELPRGRRDADSGEFDAWTGG